MVDSSILYSRAVSRIEVAAALATTSILTYICIQVFVVLVFDWGWYGICLLVVKVFELAFICSPPCCGRQPRVHAMCHFQTELENKISFILYELWENENNFIVSSDRSSYYSDDVL